MYKDICSSGMEVTFDFMLHIEKVHDDERGPSLCTYMHFCVISVVFILFYWRKGKEKVLFK